MEYQALYRKYRPQRFRDIIGQGHVTKTLAREVEEGKVAHAYLFAGPRGTGKTSTARILAKVLNCTDKTPKGEPCGVCEACVGIETGTSLDVIELDAASHNKVEDIRDLRVGVSTVASVRGARRVFILDEAHMLSKAAGNALLKTLEEPPAHVHFVLATTEPYKLLDTVRSRAQRFDFHPVPVEVIAEYLARISDAEGYEAAPQALSAIARLANGSVRDSLSLLEQVAALESGRVETGGVNAALGLADREVFGRLADAIVSGDARLALELVSTLASSGVDLRRFVSEAIAFFRGVFLAHYAPNIEEIADEPADVVEDWQRVASLISPSDVLRTVDHLTEALIRLREGREERLMVEIAVLKLTRPDVASDVPSLIARVDRLDEQVRLLGTIRPEPDISPAAAPPSVSPQSADLEEAASEDDDEQKPPAEEADDTTDIPADERPKVENLTLEQVEAVWPMLFSGVRDELGPRNQAFFREARPGAVHNSTIVLHVPPHLDFHLEQLQSNPEVGSIVADKATELLGGRVEIEFSSGPELDDESDEVPQKAPDKDTLSETAAAGVDPAELVQDLLGAEVVEEVPTEG